MCNKPNFFPSAERYEDFVTSVSVYIQENAPVEMYNAHLMEIDDILVEEELEYILRKYVNEQDRIYLKMTGKPLKDDVMSHLEYLFSNFIV